MPDCIHDIDREWCGVCNPAATPLEDRINAVFQVIPADGEKPRSLDDICWLAALNRYEVNQAVAAIRERYPDLPLVSDRNGIRFTLDEAAVRRFRQAGAKQALTLIRRRFRGAVLPYLQHAGDQAEVRRVERQLTRLMEDMEELI